MNFGFSALMAGFIFGVIGMYFIKRAKTESDVPKFLIGLSLILYPYFIENIFLLWGIGIVLILLARWL